MGAARVPEAGRTERPRLGAGADEKSRRGTCALYQAAARRYGLDWAILAGIGKVECDHGRDPDPSCTQEGAVNSAGAGGPMQFIASTWARYGVDGDGDGRADRWDPADAIYAAANYLRASGAPGDYGRRDLRLQPRRPGTWPRSSAGPRSIPRPAASPRAPLAGGEAVKGRAPTALEGESPTPVRFIAGRTRGARARVTVISR